MFRVAGGTSPAGNLGAAGSVQGGAGKAGAGASGGGAGLVLDGLPASPDLPVPCPAPRISYQLAFTRPSATRPDVEVTSGGCLTDQITIDGKAQPVLQDSGTLSAAITRLLGVTARP